MASVLLDQASSTGVLLEGTVAAGQGLSAPAQPAENTSVITCAHCGLVLQTLDLPCPVCSLSDQRPEVDPWTLHEFSKSFRTRHLVRPEPNVFVSELNEWMANQVGLVHVAPVIHRDYHGEVSGATLTCTASSRPATEIFRFFRLPLLSKPWGLRPKPVGEALNDWPDRYPDHTRVTHLVISSSGVPIECWVLAKGPPLIDGAAVWNTTKVYKPILGTAWTVFSMIAVLPIVITISAAIAVGIHAPVWAGITIIPAFLLGGVFYFARRRRRKAMARVQDQRAART